MQKIKGSSEVICGVFWRENNLVINMGIQDELDIVFVIN